MAGGSLLAALKQYVGDALPGGSLTPELAPVRQYAAGVKQRAGQLVADPAGFARSAALDVLPNEAEANAARAKLMGGSLDPQAYQSYMGKLQDMGNFLGSIRVYHGSPHKFDKFDLSKMGTGEGAQAYGHGAYFAESPKVAQEYTNKLGRVVSSIDNKPTKDVYEEWAVMALKNHPDPKAAKAYFQNLVDVGLLQGKSSEYVRPYVAAVNEAIDAAAGKKVGQVIDGSLYEASLRWPDAAREAADPLGPQHFLDWDKPLSEQSDAVKALLRKTDLIDESVWPHYTGSQLYQGEMNARGPFKANGFADSSAAPGVSELLNQQGIPGIRYLDAGSRGAGQGTSNYVVFDDALIELLKRNGVPIGK